MSDSYLGDEVWFFKNQNEIAKGIIYQIVRTETLKPDDTVDVSNTYYLRCNGECKFTNAVFKSPINAKDSIKITE